MVLSSECFTMYARVNQIYNECVMGESGECFIVGRTGFSQTYIEL